MMQNNVLLAKQLNMECEQRIRVSYMPVPEHLLVPVMFMAPANGVLTPDLATEFLRGRQLMLAVLDSGKLAPANFGIASSVEIYITVEADIPVLLRKQIRNSAWTYCGFYLQAGSADRQKANGAGLYRAIAAAQTLQDMMYVQTGSLDLALHTPLVRSARAVREYQSAVNGFYGAEIAIWRQPLLQYHTAVLVMLRAAWMNRDPLQEYQRFLSAGGEYFLQYPTLCP
jgi:hypothetical protein